MPLLDKYTYASFYYHQLSSPSHNLGDSVISLLSSDIIAAEQIKQALFNKHNEDASPFINCSRGFY